MSPTVAEMSVAELRELFDELLDEKLEEFLGDSDAGLRVRSDVREQLLRQMRRVRRGEYGVPLSGIQD
jgi:hypothetical protein